MLCAVLLSLLGTSTATGSDSHIDDVCASEQCSSVYHPIITELVEHLENNPGHKALVESVLVEGAAVDQNSTDLFPAMYRFLDSVLTLSPTKDNAMSVPFWFYRYAVTETGRELLRMPTVNDWIRRWLNQWAQYLDSPASASGILSWSSNLCCW